MSDVELKIDGLEKLLKAFKGRPPEIKVGILSNGDHRGDGSTSNATLGVFHEFGTTKMPMRSFLRMPLSTQFGKRLENSGAIDKDALKAVIKQGSFMPWANKVGALGVDVVLGAFATGGFGQWPGWSKGYSSKTGQILVNTNQLRDSISYGVKG